MTSERLPRVSLHDHEIRPAPEDDEADVYAYPDEVPPTLSPYVLLGYGPRIQLMLLFTRTSRALSLPDLIDAVDGEPAEIIEELNSLNRFGMIREPSFNHFVFDYGSPVAISIRKLIWSLQREADDMEPSDYVQS